MMNVPRELLIVCACAALCSVSVAGAESESDLREWVRKAVADPRVFVMNPPAELGAYAGLSPEQLQQRMTGIFRDGSVLMLYPNGLPFQFESRSDHKADGPRKVWHPSGQIAVDETWNSEKLVTGKYFDADGKLLAEVQNGSGTRIDFSPESVESGLVLQGKAEYAHGVKHGREIRFRDHVRGEIDSETFFEQGQKHGTEKRWMPNGQLNFQIVWSDGQKNGEELYWHSNGLLQSLAHHENGKQVGVSCRFYQNGQKSEEIFREGERWRSESRWYPEGAWMLYKEFAADSGRTARAWSFDRDGKGNGRIENGAGSLVVLAEPMDDFRPAEEYRLETYEEGRTKQGAAFPTLKWTSMAGKGSARKVEFTTAVAGPPWKSVTAEIQLPEGFHSDGPLRFESEDLSTDRPKFGPVDITFPGGDSWTGVLYAITTAATDGGSYHIKQILLESRPKRERSEPKSTPKSKPEPRESRSWNRDKRSIEVGGQELRRRDAITGWHLSKQEWLLFRAPPLLVHQRGPEEPWRVVREIPFGPAGMAILPDKSLILWGTEPTGTPEDGIPYHVERSVDSGGTWKPFDIPKMDYLLGIACPNRVLVVTGVRLPKDGVPEGKDWFQLPRSFFISSDDGKHFVEQVGPSFVAIGTIESRSIAPDGRRRAYIEVASWLDTSYAVYVADGPDEIPRVVQSTGVQPAVVWSGNSRILALQANGRYFASYDFQTGQFEEFTQGSASPTLGKEREAADAVHEKIAALLETNR